MHKRTQNEIDKNYRNVIADSAIHAQSVAKQIHQIHQMQWRRDARDARREARDFYNEFSDK